MSDARPRIVTKDGGNILLCTLLGSNDLIAASTEGRIARVNAATGRLTPFDREHDSQIVSLAVNRTGHLLASLDGDSRVFLWDPTKRQWLRELSDFEKKAAMSLAFSPDGRTLPVGHDGGTISL